MAGEGVSSQAVHKILHKQILFSRTIVCWWEEPPDEVKYSCFRNGNTVVDKRSSFGIPGRQRERFSPADAAWAVYTVISYHFPAFFTKH